MEGLFRLLGGLGLFLLGMTLLTEGVKLYAGTQLKQALMRLTGTPLKALVSGAFITLMIQSSSATTVAVVGFVSAGVVSFSQAVGIVMGASLGTTATGWVVAGIGLKVSLGFYALPMITAGAFARVLAGPRLAALGTAVAGFGLIFVGIDFLQQGMAGLGDRLALASLPEHGALAHLVAAALGLLLTIVVQSSSAAAAMALTALAAGTINFEQAASFVIGAAIGTTVTGALASISGKAPARRTAAAHILFNAATGVMALLALPWLLDWVDFAQGYGLPEGTLSLAFFHSTFILMGILVFMPLLPRYVAWLERLVPDKGSALTKHLDATLYAVPVVALEASQRALRACAAELARVFETTLQNPSLLDADPRRQEVADAIDALRRFLADLPPVNTPEAIEARLAQMHALEHLLRLQSRLFVQPDVLRHLSDVELSDARALAQRAAGLASHGLAMTDPPADWLPRLQVDADALALLRVQSRPQLLELATQGHRSPGDVLQALDAMRWLERIAHHLWRIAVHAEGEPEALEPHEEGPLPV